MENYDEQEYKGCKIEIWYDNDAGSPRDWDNLGTIYSNHRNYTPDNHSMQELIDNEKYQDDDCEFDWKKLGKDFFYLKIYAYEHGGITISASRTGQFKDKWDSGLFGVIVMSREDAKKEYGGTPEDQIEELVLKNMEAEIEILDKYYRGEVYGFTTTDENENEIEMTGGYYGVDDALSEAKYTIDAHLEAQKVLFEERKKLTESRIEKLKTIGFIVNSYLYDKKQYFFVNGRFNYSGFSKGWCDGVKGVSFVDVPVEVVDAFYEGACL